MSLKSFGLLAAQGEEIRELHTEGAQFDSLNRLMG